MLVSEELVEAILSGFSILVGERLDTTTNNNL